MDRSYKNLHQPTHREQAYDQPGYDQPGYDQSGHAQPDYDRPGHRQPPTQDREISLGTSTILGIFFALALVCALFFGLGYSTGRHSVQPTLATIESPAAGSSSTAAKPLSGSPLPRTPSHAGPTADPAPDTATIVDTPRTPTNARLAPVQPVTPAIESTDKAIASPAITPGVSSATPIVQIAAVSHREDADSLLTTLQRRGYNVTVRPEPQDKLLHVQIGPFPNHKEAEAMRLRLLGDGYNAIVK